MIGIRGGHGELDERGAEQGRQWAKAGPQVLLARLL